jgi:predicted lactoylglutathione lyase
MTRPIFNHVGIHVRDIVAARRFYDTVLACIDVRRYSDIEGFKASAYGVHESSFRIVQPDHPIGVSSSHVALTASSRAQVDAFHRKALELGATSVEAPHTYDDSAQGVKLVAYTASIKDRDGHWIEAVFVSRA